MADLTLSECVYPPEQFLARHTHERAYFSLVLRGSYTETWDSHTSDCAPSSLVLHPEGESHSDRFHSDGAHVFNIDLGGGWSGRVERYASVLNRRIEAPGGVPAHLTQQLYHEFRRNDAVSPLAVEGLMLELLAALARQSTPRPDRQAPAWLEQVRDLLHCQYLEDWTLTDIAVEVGVHPTHLARLFRRHYHCTVGEYVRQLRIQFACARLMDTETPLAEIAQQAGFADQSHFTRMFKRHYGLSPAAYRESIQPR